MTIITTRFGEGGAPMVPEGCDSQPSLQQTLRDIADDLNGVQVAKITSPDATDPPSSYLLINEIKTKLNAICSGTGGHAMKTIKG